MSEMKKSDSGKEIEEYEPAIGDKGDGSDQHI
jgi:hypothetical protein